MSSEYINNLVKTRVAWLNAKGPDCDIAVSSRIRLARNIKGFPFPVQATPLHLKEIVDTVDFSLKTSTVLKDRKAISMPQLSQLEADILLERHLISKEFSKNRINSSLIVKHGEDISLMINEEDHIRLQCILPGFQFESAWNLIDQLDSELSENIPYEFDARLGFLTSCPTNLGTGMRASVMLHLPALSISGLTEPLIHGVFKLGMTVRGILGEGSDNLGNLFQVSNQSTLGESEEAIIKRLSSIIKQIIEHERNARKKLLETRKDFLLDKIGRAYGTLKYSYLIPTSEALKSLSLLKLGVDLNIISSIDRHVVNELFITAQPAHLQKYYALEINSKERDRLRATLIRETLQKAKRKD